MFVSLYPLNQNVIYKVRSFYSGKMFNISKIVVSSDPQNISLSTIDLKKINIIVGPNNSGKSTMLKDIDGWFDNKYHQMKVLKRIEVCFSNNHNEYNEFEKDILDFQDGQPRKEGGKELIPFVKKHLFEETHSSPVWYNLEDIKYEFNRQNTEYFRQNFFRYFVIRLDGKNRFQLVESKHSHFSHE